MIALLGVFVLAYFIGSLPFGVWVSRAQGVDIFKVGSGNPGATNVARALGKKWGLIVFALDVLKGVVPAVAAQFLIKEPVGGISLQALWFVAGLGAVVGHCLSPFINFKGGKGIATALGVGLGACPLIAGGAFAVFLIVFAITRYVSLSSMIAAISAVILGWVIPHQARELVPLYALVAIFLIYRHRANIRRLMNGTEPKFGFKKKDPEPPVDDEPIDGKE